MPDGSRAIMTSTVKQNDRDEEFHATRSFKVGQEAPEWSQSVNHLSAAAA